MATVNELFRRTQRLIDDTLDNIDMVDWFNQCNNTLLNITYFPTKTTLAKNESGTFTIPTNYNGKLKILNPENIATYEIYDNKISFDGIEDVESLEIEYNRLPAAITNDPDSVPEIPVQFHDIYVFYACMMAMHPEEEPDRYTMYNNDYNRVLNQIKNYMGKSNKTTGKWTVIR